MRLCVRVSVTLMILRKIEFVIGIVYETLWKFSDRFSFNGMIILNDLPRQ